MIKPFADEIGFLKNMVPQDSEKKCLVNAPKHH